MFRYKYLYMVCQNGIFTDQYMKTAFIVQARMGSTRLPQKVLRPFYEGKCILELLISKLNQIANTKIIIATSLNAENNII